MLTLLPHPSPTLPNPEQFFFLIKIYYFTNNLLLINPNLALTLSLTFSH